jgi:hypothetical protein
MFDLSPKQANAKDITESSFGTPLVFKQMSLHQNFECGCFRVFSYIKKWGVRKIYKKMKEV